VSESIPGLNLMAQEQRKINPIDDAISSFLKQQKDYEDYLKKLREDVDKGSPREKLKEGGKVVSIGSLMDKPLDSPNPFQKNINVARLILYGRRKFSGGGSSDEDRIKELEYTIRIILPAIRDREGADLYERAKEELDLLKDRRKSF
jgi:hypothetical protein